MAEKVEYRFQKTGATRGNATGRYLRWDEGDCRTLPKGELDHMGDRFYETRPLKPDSDTQAPNDGIEHTGAGWYQVRIGGEVVDKVRGQEEAQARYEELS
jgi:hypothetical protein